MGLLNDHSQKGLMNKTNGMGSSNYSLSLFNDTINRPSLKWQHHKLVVAQAQESSLILLFPLFPLARATVVYCPN